MSVRGGLWRETSSGGRFPPGGRPPKGTCDIIPPLERTGDQLAGRKWHHIPPSPCEQTNRCKNITFPQLLWRALIRLCKRLNFPYSLAIFHTLPPACLSRRTYFSPALERIFWLNLKKNLRDNHYTLQLVRSESSSCRCFLCKHIIPFHQTNKEILVSHN